MVEPIKAVLYRCMRCGKHHRDERRALDHAVRCRCFHCDHYHKRRFLRRVPNPLFGGSDAEYYGFGCLLKKWRWADNTFPPVECDKWEENDGYSCKHVEDLDAVEWCEELPDYRKPVKEGK